MPNVTFHLFAPKLGASHHHRLGGAGQRARPPDDFQGCVGCRQCKKYNTEKLGPLLGWWQELAWHAKKHAKKHDENAAAQEQEAASQKTSKDEQESLTFLLKSLTLFVFNVRLF